MCDKGIAENAGTLRCVADCYKNQKMYDEIVDNYAHALKFVPDCHKTKNRVIKLLMLVLLHLISFLIDKRLQKCVILQRTFYSKILPQ